MTRRRIAVGASATLYILWLIAAGMIAPACQFAAVIVGGVPLALDYARLMQSDPPE